jgi:hypothetical protein
MKSLFGEKFSDFNLFFMKRLLIIIFALSFLTFSCRTIKTNNIHVSHSKEKDQFKKPADSKYTKSSKSSKKKKKTYYP